MDKASRAIKRSGAKLLSMGGSHGDISLLLSGLKEIKNTTKSLITTQSTATHDLMKWASRQENKAIQDVVSQIGELQMVWVEVQKALLDHMKDYRNMFEMILQGEKKVAQAKENLEYCDQKEFKARKDLKKASKRESSQELRMLESRVAMAEDSKNLAQIEVSDSMRENESVKLIRLKEGLVKMSTACVEVGSKCAILHAGQRDIADQLPDVHGRDLESIRYTGARSVRSIVQQTVEKVQGYKESYYRSGTEDPPPPYVPPGPDSPYQQPHTVPSNSSPATGSNSEANRKLSQASQARDGSPTTMQITNIVRIHKDSGSSDSSLSRSSSVNLSEGQARRSESPFEGANRMSGSLGSLQDNRCQDGVRLSGSRGSLQDSQYKDGFRSSGSRGSLQDSQDGVRSSGSRGSLQDSQDGVRSSGSRGSLQDSQDGVRSSGSRGSLQDSQDGARSSGLRKSLQESNVNEGSKCDRRSLPAPGPDEGRPVPQPRRSHGAAGDEDGGFT